MKSRHKTGFIGIIVDLTVFKMLANEKFTLMTSDEKIFTYFASQDHLEMLNGNLRKGGGLGRNPTCRQFISRMRAIFISSEIKLKNGSARLFEHVPVLHALKNIKIQAQINSINSNNLIDTDCDDEVDSIMAVSLRTEASDILWCEQKLCEEMGLENFSYLHSNVIGLRAGQILNILQKSLKCKFCLLQCFEESESVTAKSLHFFKNSYAFNTVPSFSLLKICETVEKIYCRAYNEKQVEFLKCANYADIIAQKFFSHTDSWQIFPSIGAHLTQCESYANHYILLIKSIIGIYSKTRRDQHIKHLNASRNELLRPKLNRLMNFKNQ